MFQCQHNWHLTSSKVLLSDLTWDGAAHAKVIVDELPRAVNGHVAGVRVGVEEAMAQNLLQVALHCQPGQPLAVETLPRVAEHGASEPGCARSALQSNVPLPLVSLILPVE